MPLVNENIANFSGSYAPSDCLFLMKPLGLASKRIFDDVSAKERLIQTGQAHYSQMLSLEEAPTTEYFDFFEQAMLSYGERFAKDIVTLAQRIYARRGKTVTLVSLARAGTPIGVLLHRRMQAMGCDSRHYSVSIVRDRGIDENALKYIVHNEGRAPESIVFVDGWTAKGMIGRELKQAINSWNKRYAQWQLPNELFVVADIGGTADVAATQDDYLIPSGILNAVVSGLVSRSILNHEIGLDEFHGCIYYDTLQSMDKTHEFITRIDNLAAVYNNVETDGYIADPQLFQSMVVDLWQVQKDYRVSDVNRIKPGIAEATRVLLRRVPDVVLVKDKGAADVAHLMLLATEKNVPVVERPQQIFSVISLIKDVT